MSGDANKLGPGCADPEPRRRSVHFDSHTTTVLVSSIADHACGSSQEFEDEDSSLGSDYETESSDVYPDKPHVQDEYLDRLSVEMSRHLRRKSAPASAIAKQLESTKSRDDSSYHSVTLSENLAALDPELRKSLTKLKYTAIENPDKDLDVIKNRLVGRDELEIYRNKQMRKRKNSSQIDSNSSLAHQVAMGSASSNSTKAEANLDEMSANELSSLIQRLEAVATRLEATSGGSAVASEIRKDLQTLRSNSSNPASAINSLKIALNALEISIGQGDNSQASQDLTASVAAFDEIVSGSLANFLNLSAKLGAEVGAQGAMVGDAFQFQRQFLTMAAKSRQPPQTDLPMLLKPTSDKISEIQSFREKNRRSNFFNHLSAISESIPALGWVAVSPAPGPFVKEMNDAGQFYTNRVLKDFKDKDKTHVDWVKAWVATLSELQAYIKQHHTTGLVWNPKGGDAKSNMTSKSGGAPSGPSGGAPLPPPPPPPGLFDDITNAGENPEKTARNALFAELNQGENVTKGLKKVTADMQTHKNPNLRGSSVVASNGAKKPAVPANKPSTQAVAKPPKFELDGKKWIVEFFKGNPNIEVEKAQPNQSVYVYKCENSTIKVNGKCNNIILDSCKRAAIVFENVVSSVEFINCQSVQMQVLGAVPTISIDKTDGCQMYLSKESLATSIITAKSSEMNVMIPSGDDFVEQPLPEQFKTTIAGTKLKTTVSESV